MTPFERLHPAVQYQVVNDFGWSGLRGLQEAAIEPVLDGADALLLAATASGKTEAAILPLLSRMEAQRWRGLSVIYVCPLKALLNNLEPRLSRMAGWLGRRAAVWHGDVSQSQKRWIAAEPPDLLLTTPESLEGMLISARIEHAWLFADLQTVVVDEVHAFATGDRGWHLLGVLSRLTRLAARPVQRLGLSATVGNPAALLDWLADGSDRPRVVVTAPSSADRRAVDVGIDFVGSLSNAAHVIASLHQGEKRLVFCDSRARVEEIAVGLRERAVHTFVSHSSVSADERRQAERAFAGESNCVIVATSTLELGIDIGDLDRVIQVGAPTTVSSYLQRLGRTGRRPGTTRNLLFLSTDLAELWLASALTLLWSRGYVEDVVAPVLPRHIVAQQILGLVLQERRLVTHELAGWLGGLAAVDGASQVLDHLVRTEFVVDEGGLISIGPRAEQEWGRRYFADLTSAFTSEPMLEVVFGRRVLGYLPPLSLAARPGPGGLVVLLAGRAWDVLDIDWRRKRVLVAASEMKGRSRWNSGGRTMNFALARAHHDVVAGGDPPAVALSQRATGKLAELRAAHAFAAPGSADRTYLVPDSSGRPVWWTFAGFRANSALLDGLPELAGADSTAGELRVRWRTGVGLVELREALSRRRDELPTTRPDVDDRALESLKFSAAVPEQLARETVAERMADPPAVRRVVAAPVRAVNAP